MSHAAAPDPDDTPLARSYVGVLVLEVIVVFALWLLGRVYS